MKHSTLKKHNLTENNIPANDLKEFTGSSYAEKITVVKRTYESISKMLKEEGSKNYIKVAVETIAEQIQRNQSAVKEYLLHTKYLNEVALTLIVSKRVSRDFFRKAKLPKTRLINDMKAIQVSESTIETTVSVAMIDFLNEYQKTGKVTNHTDLVPTYFDKNTDTLKSERTPLKITEAKSRVLKYTPIPFFDVNTIQISESAAVKELQEITTNFQYELRKRRKYGTKVMIKTLQLFINQLLKELFKVKSLQAENSKK
jgi:hypothetical protein